ncbi:unnamed protein product [Psylliodes chrysocephalus]|uniref:Uncharacterized protein n=1 Tax=Psylliodes chrysocephalus TaxID=3402493 RepID=A0A9P0D551_9CUCU|nr:unnamed protein product [Psylliodes chrysocephala]
MHKIQKLLEGNAQKRKISSVPLTDEEHQAICTQCDEDTPTALQKKFSHIAAVELAWRGCEAANCLLEYFKELDISEHLPVESNIIQCFQRLAKEVVSDVRTANN